MFPKPKQSFSSTSLHKFCDVRLVTIYIANEIEITLQEKRKEGDAEYQEDRNNTASDPVKDRYEIIAARLPAYDIAERIHFANFQLFVQRSNE